MTQSSYGDIQVETLVLGPIANNTYIIDDGSFCFVVDPGFDAECIIEALGKRRPGAIVLTHRHWDHIGAAAHLRRHYGCDVFAGAQEAGFIEEPHLQLDMPEVEGCPVDRPLHDSNRLNFGSMLWQVIATPGHTSGGICLLLTNHNNAPSCPPILISGDTLFSAAIGRTDFESGSMYEMRTSLARLRKLDPSCIVLPGHYQPTTIGDESQRVFDFYC